MKKTIALVGAGALVMTLGLNSGFAQQTVSPSVGTPPAAVQPKAPAAENVNKDNMPLSKPTTSAGTETAAKPSVEKSADKGTAVKPVEEPKAEKAATAPKTMDKTVAVKPETESKVEKTPTAPAPAGKESDKAAMEKAPEVKPGQAAVLEKSNVEKSSDKKEEAKPVVKQ
jgi:hypothetical protein